MDEIHLRDLQMVLANTHIVLKQEFLKQLLVNAAKSDFPHKKISFIEKIGCTYNPSSRTSTTIVGWINGYRTIPFKRLQIIISMSDFTWEDVESNVISIKAGIRKGEIMPIFPIKVKEKLGAIVGYILGDGTLDKKYSQIAFYNSNLVLLKHFSNSMKNIFGIEPRIWVQKKKKKLSEKSIWVGRVKSLEVVSNSANIALFYPRVCGLILKGIFGDFAVGKTKKITSQIKEANLSFQRGFIRAFFDSEGSAYNYRSMIRVYQDNKIMLQEIRGLLSNFDIKTNNVRTYVQRNKERSMFDITNTKNFMKFHKEIGFLSPKKKLHPR